MDVDYIQTKHFIEKCHHFEEDLLRKQDEIRRAHMLYLRLLDEATIHRESSSSTRLNYEENSNQSYQDIEVRDDQWFKDIFERTPVSEVLQDESAESTDPVDVFLLEVCSEFLHYLTSLFETLKKPGNFASALRLKEDIHTNFKKQMRSVELHFKKVIDKLNEEPSGEVHQLMQRLESKEKSMEELNYRLYDLELENQELNHQVTMYENGNEMKTLKDELKRKDVQVSKLQIKLHKKERAEEERNDDKVARDDNYNDSVNAVVDLLPPLSPNEIIEVTETVHRISQFDLATSSKLSTFDEKEEFVCSGCNEKFFSKKRLRDHFRENFVADGQWYKCSFSMSCSLKENNALESTTSSRTQSPELPSLPDVSTSKINPTVDCAESSGGNIEGKYTCNSCGKMFFTKAHLRNHIQKNSFSKGTSLKCVSEESLSKKRYYKITCVSLNDKVQCTIRNKIFKRKRSSRVHLRKHNERPFECRTCGKVFSHAGHLLAHQTIHTKKRRSSVCKFDGKTLPIYRRIRTGERRYTCKTCEKTFSTSRNLRDHQRIHTEERPHVCKTCNKTFFTSRNLRDHQRIHTGERPYACETCGKTFSQSGNLRTHERIHTGERPYACETCKKTFSQSVHLRTHQRIHTRERPNACQTCGKNILSKGILAVSPKNS